MKILILNGNTKSGHAEFTSRVHKIKNHLSQNHTVSLFDLEQMNIMDCIGCYACWLKTPGICALKDDIPKIHDKYVKSELVILATPLMANFVSPLIKRISDRSLPLIHPYLCIENDRMKHVSRYEKLPKKIFLLDRLDETTYIEEILKVEKRNCIHIDMQMEELENAIINA